jgi:hypothetical protein
MMCWLKRMKELLSEWDNRDESETDPISISINSAHSQKKNRRELIDALNEACAGASVVIF